MRRPVQHALAGGFLVLVLAATLGAGEWVLRWRERARGTPGTLALAMYQHRRLERAFIRDLDYFGWAHIDSHGFRGERTDREKSPGVLRIMAVGGSTTFDAFVAGDENAWPARLQHWLRQLAPERPVEVINAGTPSYTVQHNLTRLQAELLDFRPDVMVLYQLHNDLALAVWRLSRPIRHDDKRPEEVRPLTPWGRWLVNNSLLYTRIVGKWRSWRSRRVRASIETVPQSVIRQAVSEGAARFERDIAAFLAVTRQAGVCVIFPEVNHLSGAGSVREDDPERLEIWRRTFPSASPEVVLEAYEEYRKAMRRAVSHVGGGMVIPTGSFGLAGTENYAPGDPIHFSARGAERMGRELARAVTSRGILSSLDSCLSPAGGE